MVVIAFFTTYFRRKEVTMTKIEKIDQIWQLEIHHPLMQQALCRVEACHKSYFRKGEKVNMFISGDTGLGKTTICRNYITRFPRDRDEKGAIIPVLYTRAPSSPTLKSLTTKMLDDLGDPTPDKGVFVKQKIRLKKLIKACRTQIVFLDELQHLIDPDSERILEAVSDLVKELIDELGIPIVMVGLPKSVRVLTSNRQLGRRVSQRTELSEFGWKTSAQKKQFRSLLKTIDEKLPLSKSSQLATVDRAKRFHYATNGVMDHIMKLVRHSAEAAVEKNMDCIDLPLLEEVYDRYISHLFPERFNPFADQNLDRQLRVPRKKSESTGQEGVSKRTYRRRKKETPGDVLKK